MHTAAPVTWLALPVEIGSGSSLIMQTVAGEALSDPKKQAGSDWLHRLDTPEHSISPLLSIMEGEKGDEDGVSERKRACKKRPKR
jgi:hypothetical protein